MNEITKIVPTQDEIIRVLGNSLYPGARPESIALVLSYCKMNGLDPMLKPVHIVPQRIKNERGQWESRDVLMPGIADYRIKAARSGEYAGKSEPEFGPDVTMDLGGGKATFPQWCRVTVQRIIAGQARTFSAKEYWLENYATAGADTEAPNRMWRKRPYGQLAKCAESQALRQAFPEFSGGQPSAEEMGGGENAEVFTGPIIDAKPERSPSPAPTEAAPEAEYEGPRYPFATRDGGHIFRTGSEFLERWRRLVESCRNNGALDKLAAAFAMNQGPIAEVAEFDPQAAAEVREMVATATGLADDVAKAEAEMQLPQ